MSTEKDHLSRAGLPPASRILTMTTVGSLWGFVIGSYIGGRQSGVQYLAENAHKLPRTVQGWYFYHKTKNYKVMMGGIRKGFRFAGKTGGLCLAYGLIEAAIDRAREEADVINSAVAGVTTGAMFAAMTKLSRQSVRYSLAFGATCGLVTGGLNDLQNYINGQPPSYVQWARRRFDASSDKTAEAEAEAEAMLTGSSIQKGQEVVVAAPAQG
ncbi:hypothetical protein BC936DRAFT_149032 [Jimgerdemannia flammicorona]|uniref:Uncharacterized protein n=2 Tax=Jimgerdemannia flammicorona TaxID=994334 RepID=A0A433QFQ9_9FUNG|nr:hypothetical protein BC936DRAFT_149032 [Jimgerdemannia flammicorona]RUS28411.1 hypothetical protein BC938DRAFT_481920 [Jimgerdemannia flammicorona]